MTPKTITAKIVVPEWAKFRKTKHDRKGLWLAALRGGEILVGNFYCGEFVQDGFPYNSTPGLISQITHIKRITPPRNWRGECAWRMARIRSRRRRLTLHRLAV